MSFLRTWWAAMLHKRPDPDPLKVQLDRRQLNIAERLSHLTGQDRDEVLGEAYRRRELDMRLALWRRNHK